MDFKNKVEKKMKRGRLKFAKKWNEKQK